MTPEDLLKPKFTAIIVGFITGTLVAIVGIAVFRWPFLGAVGISIVLMTGIWGQHRLRCPYCRRSVYRQAVVPGALWRSRLPKRCPHCEAPFDKDLSPRDTDRRDDT